MKTSILIIDDDERFAQLLRQPLGDHGYHVLSAHNADEAFKLLQAEEIDIILLDILLPGMDGFEFCLNLRSSHQHLATYVIMGTALTQTDDKVTGLDCGADDYLTKPLEINELLARVRKGERELINRRNSSIDPLTRLYNRFFFNTQLAREIEAVKRYGGTLSLMILDLDHFKEINDQFGHMQGDAVLVRFSEMLQDACRTTDIACRWGGEEFLLLLPKTLGQDAYNMAERIRLQLKEIKFLHKQALTVSIGVAEFRSDVKQFFDSADQALYQAKQNGRDCSVLASPPLAESAPLQAPPAAK